MKEIKKGNVVSNFWPITCLLFYEATTMNTGWGIVTVSKTKGTAIIRLKGMVKEQQRDKSSATNSR